MEDRFYTLFSKIDTKWLKEPQFYETDAGCTHKYELVTVELVPDGNSYKPKTILYRDTSDFITKCLQPIWDDKAAQKRLKKLRDDDKAGKKKKWKPIQYRKLKHSDIKDILLQHYVYYKWLKEHVKDDFEDFPRLIGVINALDFMYRGVADVINTLIDNDINTVEHVDLKIAQLTMNKKEYHAFFEKWLADAYNKRDEKERAKLKGLICHFCNVPMEEVAVSGSFTGKGHYMGFKLRGRQCTKCKFVIYLPDDVERYVEDNVFHYVSTKNLDGVTLNEEIKSMIAEHDKKTSRFDSAWSKRSARNKRVLADIRVSKKRGKSSKYFGTLDK